MNEYKIEKVKDYTEKTHVIFEHDVQFNGCSYVVIFGRHINGGFVAVPNWNVCAEVSADGSILYNAERLEECGLDQAAALTIARHIKTTLDNMNQQ